jgi:hypothetical protein
MRNHSVYRRPRRRQASRAACLHQAPPTEPLTNPAAAVAWRSEMQPGRDFAGCGKTLCTVPCAEFVEPRGRRSHRPLTCTSPPESRRQAPGSVLKIARHPAALYQHHGAGPSQLQGVMTKKPGRPCICRLSRYMVCSQPKAFQFHRAMPQVFCSARRFSLCQARPIGRQRSARSQRLLVCQLFCGTPNCHRPAMQ